MNEGDPKDNDWKYTAVDRPNVDGSEAPSQSDYDPLDSNQVANVPAPPNSSPQEEFSWSAPDSFSTIKTKHWYIALCLITVIACLLIYVITRDKISTAVLLVSGLVIGYYAAKKPKIVNYKISKYGFKVNDRYYAFGGFKSFVMIRHGETGISAILTPLKRFMPYTYINFTNDTEAKITDALSDILPMKNDDRDLIDRLIKKIGF